MCLKNNSFSYYFYEYSESIKDFLNLILESNSKLEDVNKLIIALDKLVVSIHEIEYKFDDSDYTYNTSFEYSSIRTKVEQRFPDLGLYNTALDVSNKIGETKLATGDAIDDITDITLDLLRVEWRFQNTSKNDALWYCENLYTSHFGRHLRNLQLYLHELYL